MTHFRRNGFKTMHPTPKYVPLVKFLKQGRVREKLHEDSECSVDRLLVYVAMEKQHQPIKSQRSVYLVSKPGSWSEGGREGEREGGRERERKGEKGRERERK